MNKSTKIISSLAALGALCVGTAAMASPGITAIALVPAFRRLNARLLRMVRERTARASISRPARSIRQFARHAGMRLPVC